MYLTKNNMKVLVVGYGSIGKRHVSNLLKISNIEVIVYTRQKNLQQLKGKCIVYDNLKDCLMHKPNAAIIANNTNEHIKIALKLAKHGIHLFIEKPLSNSLSGIQKLLEFVENKKMITMIGCNLRFHKCILKIKELVDHKSIGKIISVSSESGSYLPDWHPNENYKKSYASKEDLGGGVILTCIHEIDYLYWFFGEIKEVFSSSGNYTDLKISAEDLSISIIHFKNDIIGELHLDYFQRPAIRKCKIIGTKGIIYWDSDINTVKIYDVIKKKWKKELVMKKYDRNVMYLDEIVHFLDCVKKSKKTINPISQGITILKTALAMKKSSNLRKVVRID